MGNRIFASVSLCLLAVAAHAGNAPARVALNIEPQPVRAALKELSDQAGVQVLLRVDNISLDGVMAPKVSGTLTMQIKLVNGMGWHRLCSLVLIDIERLGD